MNPEELDSPLFFSSVFFVSSSLRVQELWVSEALCKMTFFINCGPW